MRITEVGALLRDVATMQGELQRTLLALGIATLIGVAVWASQEWQMARAGGAPLGWFGVGTLSLLAVIGVALAAVGSL